MGAKLPLIGSETNYFTSNMRGKIRQNVSQLAPADQTAARLIANT